MGTKGIRIENLSKRFGKGDTAFFALKDVNMRVTPGEVVGMIGPSGSGKSTLLKCLGAVIDPTAGRMILDDSVIYDDGWKVRDLRALRRDKIGFVFQAPYLIPFLDATDNVALLPMLAGDRGVSQGLIGMAHRGRLNVLSNLLGKQPRQLFAEFEDIQAETVMGSGDVKYHMGYST